MAASTSGLCAEGKPLAGGARLQEGWAVGGLVRNQPPAETKSEPKLVDVPFGASADAGSIPAASIRDVAQTAGSGDSAARLFWRGGGAGLDRRAVGRAGEAGGLLRRSSASHKPVYGRSSGSGLVLPQL